jgi:hypothetical protein
MHQDTAEHRARFVYETLRTRAVETGAPIVPEPWEERDEVRRAAFTETVNKRCDEKGPRTPQESHEEWVAAVAAEGWTYGPVRDVENKTHPNMVAWIYLDPAEQAKDIAFMNVCELARLFHSGR